MLQETKHFESRVLAKTSQHTEKRVDSTVSPHISLEIISSDCWTGAKANSKPRRLRAPQRRQVFVDRSQAAEQTAKCESFNNKYTSRTVRSTLCARRLPLCGIMRFEKLGSLKAAEWN